MKKELPKYLAPRDENPANNKEYKYIPKKIFQTYETTQVSSGMYDAVHTWIDKNPDWEYHFFDKGDRRNFIKDNFPKKVLAAYDTLIPGAYKADLWRYCILYIYGGVYNDIKQELFISLNDVFPSDVEFLSIKDLDVDREFPVCIYQAFICSKPKHPFLKKVIDMVCENVELGYYGYDVFSPTGPAAIGKAINLVINKPESNPHIIGSHDISGYKYILWAEDFSNHMCLTDKLVPVFSCTYSNYYHERIKKSASSNVLTYGRMWYFNQIYTHGKIYRPNEARYKQKIKSERASWVNSLYKYAGKEKARRGVCISIISGHVSFRLLWLFIRYECVNPVIGFLKLISKFIFKLINKKKLEV